MEGERFGESGRRSPWLVVALPLALCTSLICLRMPQIVISGRFWAEEGSEFFHNAWEMPPLHALFTPYAGYLNLVATASTLIARWALPLTLAPYLTIAIALLIQLCAPLLLLTAKDNWLRPPHVRLTAILIVLFVSASDEVCLNTLCSQFHLTLCGALILALDVEPGRMAVLRLGMLVLAPLSGPSAAALIPLFALRTALEPSYTRAVQTAALGTGAAIQLLLFFQPLPGRAYTLNPLVLLCAVTIRHVESPFMGVVHAENVAAAIRARLTAGYIPKRAILLPLLGLGTIIWSLARHPRARAAQWFFCAAVLIAAISYFGAIGGVAALLDVRSGERYAFLPQVLLELGIVAVAANAQGWMAHAAWFVIVWLLCVGFWQCAHPWPFIGNGPAWRDEVALWHTDPMHALKIWPAGWSVTLDPARR